jgi:hypothetical protein
MEIKMDIWIVWSPTHGELIKAFLTKEEAEFFCKKEKYSEKYVCITKISVDKAKE